jgi:hypothetical protein
MQLSKFKLSLVESLIDSCEDYLHRIKKDIGADKVYAFTIYCSSACRSMGVAIATIESLRRKNSMNPKNETAAFINMMNASEWEYVNLYYEYFSQVDDLIDEFYDCLYDEGFEDRPLDESTSSSELGEFSRGIFIEALSQVILRLKAKGAFSGAPFEEDVLLGLQFGDPSLKGIEMIEAVSERVNSPNWHDKVVRNSGYVRNGVPGV